MTIKVRNAMKNVSIFSLLLLFFISCTDDEFTSVNAGFINNLNFVTDTIVSDITFSSEDVPSVQSTPAGQYLLGVYDDPNFGTLQASFVSQLALPTDVRRYSTIIYTDSLVTSTIDDVVLYIPYQATVTSINEDGLYLYQLDSIYGVRDYETDPVTYGSFDIEVHELGTFLNPLDPTDPSKVSTYYTDKPYTEKVSEAASNGFLAAVTYTPSALDTVTSISRTIDEVTYEESISMTNNAPRMAIRLDKGFFQTEFLDKLPVYGEDTPAIFSSQESFTRYFKGLFVKTTSSEAASMLSLLLSNAYIEIYYTNTITSISSKEVIDEIPEEMSFYFGGVKASQYIPTIAAKDPSKIYVQGAAGSIANIKLLGYDDQSPFVVTDELASLRELSNDEDGNPLWLINEASLQFYLEDEDLTSATDTVHKLFLYKKVQGPELESLYNSQLLDYITAATISSVEGNLLKDDNGYYYKFRITDYITNLLDGSTTTNVDNLGLKLYNNGDYPTTSSDTIVSSASWDPRGVVLHGGVSGDESDLKRAVLKINYSYQKTTEE